MQTRFEENIGSTVSIFQKIQKEKVKGHVKLGNIFRIFRFLKNDLKN